MPRTASRAPAPPDAVHPGMTASVSLMVTESDTAVSLRSGDVPVLATPRLVALCEEASCQVLEGRLAPGRTSVASRVQFDHLVPVPVGAKVTAEATLEKVEGRRLVFTISVALDAQDRAALVAAGRLTRVAVDRPAFLAKARCDDPSLCRERGAPTGPAAPTIDETLPAAPTIDKTLPAAPTIDGD